MSLLAEVHRRFLPGKLLLGVDSAASAGRLSRVAPVLEGKGPPGGRPAAFVCRGGACKLPARDLEVFRRQLEE
jgi:uncharacterized protein YyaL (SSP411 family)